MNPQLLAVMTLRSLADVFTTMGNPLRASVLRHVANGIESGADVDAHMQGVADALNEDNPATWDDVHARIQTEAAELRNR